MACDIRFASRERAIFGQPEVGTGLIPGGGALQRLPLLVGRSRAIEISHRTRHGAVVSNRYGCALGMEQLASLDRVRGT